MDELFELTKQTRLYLLSQMENPLFFERGDSVQKRQVPLKLVHVDKPALLVKAEQKQIPIEKKENEAPKKEKTIQQSAIDEMKFLLKKHNPSQYRNDFPIFVQLITINESSLPFLQKLGLAITESILPAMAYLCKEEQEIRTLLASPSLKILLAPLAELEPIINIKGEIHELTKIEKSVYWIPLHPCAQYLKDPALKRSLWNKLKNPSFVDSLV